jgi:hypothetical protein
MHKNFGESHLSSARFVWQPADTRGSLAHEKLRCHEVDAINQEHCQAHDVNRLTY